MSRFIIGFFGRKSDFENPVSVARGDFKGAGETWDDVLQELVEARQQQNRRELLAKTEDDDYVPLEEVRLNGVHGAAR